MKNAIFVFFFAAMLAANSANAQTVANPFGNLVPDSISWIRVTWSDSTQHTEHIVAVHSNPLYIREITAPWDTVGGKDYVLISQSVTGRLTTTNDASVPFMVEQFANGGPLVFTAYPAPGAHVAFHIAESRFARPGEIVYTGEWHNMGYSEGDPFGKRKPIYVEISLRK